MIIAIVAVCVLWLIVLIIALNRPDTERLEFMLKTGACLDITDNGYRVIDAYGNVLSGSNAAFEKPRTAIDCAMILWDDPYYIDTSVTFQEAKDALDMIETHHPENLETSYSFQTLREYFKTKE